MAQNCTENLQPVSIARSAHWRFEDEAAQREQRERRGTAEYWENHYPKIDDIQFDAAMLAEAPLAFLQKVMKHQVGDSANKESPSLESSCKHLATADHESDQDMTTKIIEEHNSIIMLMRSFGSEAPLRPMQSFTWDLTKGGTLGKPHASTLALDSATSTLTYTTKQGLKQAINHNDIHDVVLGCQFEGATRRETIDTTEDEDEGEGPKRRVSEPAGALRWASKRLGSIIAPKPKTALRIIPRRCSTPPPTAGRSNGVRRRSEASLRSVQSVWFGALDESRSFTVVCSDHNKVFQASDQVTRAYIVTHLVGWLQCCQRGLHDV
jgi:hypothetical protein